LKIYIGIDFLLPVPVIIRFPADSGRFYPEQEGQPSAGNGAAAPGPRPDLIFQETTMDKLVKRMGNVVLKSKPALLITLLALIIPTQIVKANPSPGPEDWLIGYYLNNHFIVFLLTFVVEFFIVWTRGPDELGTHPYGFVKTALAVAVINLLTLTCLWVYFYFESASYLQYFCIALPILEALVVAVEALFYKRFFGLPMRRALILSIRANLASYFAGVIFFAVITPRPDYSLDSIGNSWE
jgi:hypothetical protein